MTDTTVRSSESPVVQAWRFAGAPLSAYVACRVACLSVFALAAHLMPVTFGGAPFLWDGSWYEQVARHGYPSHVPSGQSTLAFFPVFPMLGRAVAFLTPLSVRTSLLAVDTICGALFAVVVWRLLLRLMPELEAQRALAIVVFFPGVFVLSLAYSEPVMLLFAALCLLDLHDERWLRAGVWGALATASRPNAIALVLAGLGAAWLAQRRGQGWKPYAAPVLSCVGFGGFLAYLAVRTGDALAWLHAQRNGWDEHTDFGRTTYHHLVDAASHPLKDMNISQAALGTIIFAALLAYAWRRLPLPLFLYGLGIAGLAVSSHALGARPRYLLTAFPLLFPLARPLRDLRLSMWVAVSMTLMASLAWITLTSLALTP